MTTNDDRRADDSRLTAIEVAAARTEVALQNIIEAIHAHADKNDVAMTRMNARLDGLDKLAARIEGAGWATKYWWAWLVGVVTFAAWIIDSIKEWSP